MTRPGIWLLALACLAWAAPVRAQESPVAEAGRFQLFETQDFTVDLVGVDQGDGSGDFAAEWKFDLRRELDLPMDLGHTHVDAHLTGNGFLVLTGGDNEKDQIKTKLELDFLPLFAVDPPGGVVGIG
ncbi:MAG: hypothetical protein MJE66_13325, partial [Proteobacteria bacterium]|nr:hypothetical protein [Pseudomonadota bacterium]